MFLDTHSETISENIIILIEAKQTRGTQEFHTVHYRYGQEIRTARAHANDVANFLELVQ